MNTTFEHADRFGFSSQFSDNESESNIVHNDRTNFKLKIKSRIVFLGPISYERDYHDKIIISSESRNHFVVYALKNHDARIIKSKVSSLEESGVSFKDIETFFGLQLGYNLVEAIKKDKENSQVIVDDMLNWLSVTGEERKTLKELFLKQVIEYCNSYPDFMTYTPPNGWDDFMKLIQACILYGMQGLADLGNRLFKYVADLIRKLKLSDNHWNPKVIQDYEEDKKKALKNGEKFEKPKPKGYHPIIKSPKALMNVIDSMFDGFEPIFNESKETDTYAVEAEQSLKGILFNIIQFAKQFLKDAFGFIDEGIKCYNAVLVGVYNGLIDVIANIVEGIGSLLSLLNPDNVKALVDGVSKIFENGFWEGMKTLIGKAVKHLFNFVDDDHIYKNAYEFGVFIARAIEIVFDVVLAYKGAVKLGKKVIDLTKLAAQKSKVLKRRIDNVLASIVEYSQAFLKAFADANVQFYIYIKEGAELLVDDFIRLLRGNQPNAQLSYCRVTVNGQVKVDVPAKEFFDEFSDISKKNKVSTDEVNTRIDKLEKSANNKAVLRRFKNDIADYKKLRKALKEKFKNNPDLLTEEFNRYCDVFDFPKDKNLSFYDDMVNKTPELKGAFDADGVFRQTNFAEFKTQLKSNGKVTDEVVEFAHSGNNRISKDFIDGFDGSLEAKQFQKGIEDIYSVSRRADSEVKYIYNFIKKHLNRADEFVIETKNIYFTCTSCQRELIMLKSFVESKGKKMKIIIHGDKDISGADAFLSDVLKKI